MANFNSKMEVKVNSSVKLNTGIYNIYFLFYFIEICHSALGLH